MIPPEWVELLLVHIHTRVATVMKCSSEMFASKLFWMYLERKNMYLNCHLIIKRSAPPIKFDTTCAYPEKDEPECQGSGYEIRG